MKKLSGKEFKKIKVLIYIFITISLCAMFYPILFLFNIFVFIFNAVLITKFCKCPDCGTSIKLIYLINPKYNNHHCRGCGEIINIDYNN